MEFVIVQGALVMVTPPGAQKAMLYQMQQLSIEARHEPVEGHGVRHSVGEAGFADELHSSLLRINQLQSTAREQAMAFQAGDSGYSLNQVMVNSQKASLAFEAGVQLRNRLLTAYKEIMNMQV
ncbi:flagellar hook-basal body complex protein FliE [Halioglobus sp. HI00S01]|uniref:flagellar hook-basal body complex protein FliE n=1 Tax=Halioglobus sp. HI00S01 TaxID=1822214 RepID=UPI0018D30025|nr:flagellar hook-basal body complex protein FliE [Halioglobus sp. HI00S01]